MLRDMTPARNVLLATILAFALGLLTIIGTSFFLLSWLLSRWGT